MLGIDCESTWFIPAFANRRVGSSKGIVGDEGANTCFFERKKVKNSSLTRLADQGPVYGLIMVVRGKIALIMSHRNNMTRGLSHLFTHAASYPAYTQNNPSSTSSSNIQYKKTGISLEFSSKNLCPSNCFPCLPITYLPRYTPQTLSSNLKSGSQLVVQNTNLSAQTKTQAWLPC